MIEYDEALRLVLEAITERDRQIEQVPLLQAIGRVVGESIHSDRDYPPFDRATMDGFAVRTADYSAIQMLEIEETIFAGDAPSVLSGGAVRIMTGAAVPSGADCVIPREEIKKIGMEEQDTAKETIVAIQPSPGIRVVSGRNIARRGEDLKKGDSVFQRGDRINETMVGLLASIGQSRVSCLVPPRITIVSTGNEVVSVDETPGPTRIRDSNTYTLRSFFGERSIPVQRCLHIRDEPEEARKILEDCLRTDLLILSGAVSAGDADFVPPVLRDLGVEQIFHGVAIKPGKPLWFGRKEDCLVFGLPGNPVAVHTALSLFFEPLLFRWFGIPPQQDWILPVLSDVKPDQKRLQILPARLVFQEDRYGAEVIARNGSGDVRTLSGAHGLILLDNDSVTRKKARFRPFSRWWQ